MVVAGKTRQGQSNEITDRHKHSYYVNPRHVTRIYKSEDEVIVDQENSILPRGITVGKHVAKIAKEWEDAMKEDK